MRGFVPVGLPLASFTPPAPYRALVEGVFVVPVMMFDGAYELLDAMAEPGAKIAEAVDCQSVIPVDHFSPLLECELFVDLRCQSAAFMRTPLNAANLR